MSSGRWTIALLNGPNMSHLGKRDRRIYGTIGSLEELEALVIGVGKGLGAAVEPFHHNEEGSLVDFIEDSRGRFDAYLINPGGLWAFGEPTRIALGATGRPVVEVHFANIVATGGESTFTRSVRGSVMGLRQHGYLGGLIALIGALDSASASGHSGVSKHTAPSRKDPNAG